MSTQRPADPVEKAHGRDVVTDEPETLLDSHAAFIAHRAGIGTLMASPIS